jgi:hypothetical protein
VPPGTVRSARVNFSSISPAWSKMDARPAGQGFMSTQRRENRWRRNSWTGSAKAYGVTISGTIAQPDCAEVSGGTAPPVFLASSHPSDVELSPGASVGMATNSLLSGYRIVRLVLQDLRHSSPPLGAGLGAETGTPAIHGSPLPHIPFPSGLARLHLTLPRVPAGRGRWAERYDGKGNMHLQHAA